MAAEKISHKPNLLTWPIVFRVFNVTHVPLSTDIPLSAMRPSTDKTHTQS